MLVLSAAALLLRRPAIAMFPRALLAPQHVMQKRALSILSSLKEAATSKATEFAAERRARMMREFARRPPPFSLLPRRHPLASAASGSPRCRRSHPPEDAFLKTRDRMLAQADWTLKEVKDDFEVGAPARGCTCHPCKSRPRRTKWARSDVPKHKTSVTPLPPPPPDFTEGAGEQRVWSCYEGGLAHRVWRDGEAGGVDEGDAPERAA